MFIGQTACNPSLTPGPHEDWRGYINGTIPILSFWAHIGYIISIKYYNMISLFILQFSNHNTVADWCQRTLKVKTINTDKLTLVKF